MFFVDAKRKTLCHLLMIECPCGGFCAGRKALMLNTRCMLCLELADGTMLPVNESRLLCEKLMRRGVVRTKPATLLRESGFGPAVASGLLCYEYYLI